MGLHTTPKGVSIELVELASLGQAPALPGTLEVKSPAVLLHVPLGTLEAGVGQVFQFRHFGLSVTDHQYDRPLIRANDHQGLLGLPSSATYSMG